MTMHAMTIPACVGAPARLDASHELAALSSLFERFQSRDALLLHAAETSDLLLDTSGCQVVAAGPDVLTEAATDGGTVLDVRVHGEVVAHLLIPAMTAPSAARALCRLLGAAIEKHETRQLLEARFVSWGLSSSDQHADVRRSVDQHVLDGVNDPDKVARLLGRAFHDELSKAGFASGAILRATGEIVGRMTQALRHS